MIKKIKKLFRRGTLPGGCAEDEIQPYELRDGVGNQLQRGDRVILDVFITGQNSGMVTLHGAQWNEKYTIRTYKLSGKKLS